MVSVIQQAPPHSFSVEVVVGGRDAESLAQVAKELGARYAVISDPQAYLTLKRALSGTSIAVGAGHQAVMEAVERPCDRVVAAISGAAGVEPTYAALKAGRTLALANKECLVCAGGPFMRAVQAENITLLPMDSEHNALYQLLQGHDLDLVDRMILTGSGGPFLRREVETFDHITPREALAHPRWSMGPKISVDSASLMNKGLELIEAQYLFSIPPQKLDVLIQPQSIVHGLVSFQDGAVLACLAIPDMRVPIAHCLAYPSRQVLPSARLDLVHMAEINFEKPDLKRFPALRLAQNALMTGCGLPTILNAANEIAVQNFLETRISFPRMIEIVDQTCEKALQEGNAVEPQTISDALELDRWARARARALIF